MATVVAKTKVVVRGLPPNLSDEDFAALLEKHAPGKTGWSALYRGDQVGHKGRPAMAFVDLKNADDVALFRDRMQAQAIVNEKGHTYRCVVEYAPQQKVPRGSRKDPREGTIEKDKDFKDFVKQLESGTGVFARPKPEGAEPPAEASRAPRVTALMQYLQEKHKKKADEKLRGKFRSGKGAPASSLGKGAPVVLPRPQSSPAAGASGKGGAPGPAPAPASAKGRKVPEPIKEEGGGRKDRGGRKKDKAPEGKAVPALVTRPASAAAGAGEGPSQPPAVAPSPAGDRGKGRGGERAPREKKAPVVVALPVPARKKDPQPIVDRPAPTIDLNRSIHVLKKPNANAPEFKPTQATT